MRDSNLPKFLADDVPLFRAILVDLFPGVEVPTDDYGDLLVAIKAEIAERGLQQKESLIHKIIQLHDMIKIRFGVTIVGPTGGGKTVAYEIMCAAHSRCSSRAKPLQRRPTSPRRATARWSASPLISIIRHLR